MLDAISRDRLGGNDRGAFGIRIDHFDPDEVEADVEIGVLFQQNVGGYTSAEETRVSSRRNDSDETQFVLVGVEVPLEWIDRVLERDDFHNDLQRIKTSHQTC